MDVKSLQIQKVFKKDKENFLLYMNSTNSQGTPNK